MKHIFLSFSYALKGLLIIFKEEKSFRIQIVITILVFVLGIYLGLSNIEWAIISITAFFILSIEALNTAIEDLCNKVEPNKDPLIGKIKDISAGAVLLVSIGSILVAVFILVPHLLKALF